MKSSRESNINKLTSKLGLVKKAGYTPPPSAMGPYAQVMHNKHEPKPDPVARKKVDRFKLDEKRHGVKIPKYSLYYDENLDVAYLIDENNNVVTLDDIKNHPLYGPAMLQHIAPELAGTEYKDLDEATKKKLGDYLDDARKAGRQFYVDDITGVYEDGFDELENRYHNVYGAPLHSGLANSEHKLKDGDTPYIIGGDVLNKLPVLTITDANGNVTKKKIVTPETVMQALAALKATGDAILEDDLNSFFNKYYSPQEVYKYHDNGTLRYVILNYYNPETGKFEQQDLSDDDWTSGWDKIFNKEEAAKLYRPRDHFVPAYQQAVAIAMGGDKDTIDPFYELGNLGHVLAGEDGISRLGGVKDYVDLGSYLDEHLKQLQEALRDKEAFQAAMDYVERGNALNEWYKLNELSSYGKINPLTGLYEGKPLPQDIAMTMPQMPASLEGNAKAKLIYDFISKNAEALRRQGKALSDLLSGKTKSIAVYDELGNAIPMDLMRFSSMMNEGQTNPVFIDHLGREFSKKPKYIPNFKTHAANHLLGVHDDLLSDPNNPYDLQKGFFSKNPAYAKYNAENPLVAMQLGRIADSGLHMRQRSQNDSDILAGLLGQQTADFLKSLKENAHGASYDHTAKLLNLGLLLNDQTYRRNNYKDLSLSPDSAWTNRTFASAATQNPLSKTLDTVGSGVGKGVGYAVGGVGSLFGLDWYDETVPFFGAAGNLITDVIDPGHLIHGTMATATGAPFDRFGRADQNEWLKENITKQLEAGFKERGYNYNAEDYYNTSYLGNISNLLAGDQASIFNDPRSLRAISVLELGAPFLPMAGGRLGKAVTPGISTSSRISPMILGSMQAARNADDLVRISKNMDDILLRSADGTQTIPFREAAIRLGTTTDDLLKLLDNSNTYKALFGQDGVADLRPGTILGHIRNMYNGNAIGSAVVAGTDLATFGGAIPNTLTGAITNPRRAFTIRGMYDAQNQWAKGWNHAFNGTLPKQWWQLDLSADGRRLSPFDTIDDLYRAFGKYHPDNILWDRYSGGYSPLGNALYNPRSVLRYSYPVNQFRMAADAANTKNLSSNPAHTAVLLYVSLNDHTPEVMRGELISLHVTNPNTIAALNPRSKSNTLGGKFPWLALGVGAGAAGLGIYLYNKKKEEEEKRKRLQLMKYLLLGQVYRPHVGRQYMR